MSDSEDDEAEAAEFMSQPEINEFLEEAEEEKEQLAGRSGRHWKPMVFEEVFEQGWKSAQIFSRHRHGTARSKFGAAARHGTSRHGFFIAVPRHSTARHGTKIQENKSFSFFFSLKFIGIMTMPNENR